MAEEQTTEGQLEAEPEGQPEAAPDAGLEHGTYEVIRHRLNNHGQELRRRLEDLNQARKDVFGAIDTVLLATERVTTDNNCTPRDMVPVGDNFIFGYNVQMGLKSEIKLADVFSVYEFREHAFRKLPLDLISDDTFVRDFEELHKYYKKSVFAKFSIIGPHLFMVFRVGEAIGDIKTFKWLIDGGRLQYVDARSDHQFRFPAQHEFEWTRTHRDMHAPGLHPHVSIENRLFVEAVGGDLTIKIENNTETGEGIYSEPVDNVDQTLDDAEYFYSIVGNLILLKVHPYQEERFRYFVYSEKTQQVRRLDSIANACVLLPDDHGLIFSNGYFLQTGEHKIFQSALTDMTFTERVQSPNGEDFLYVFYDRRSGVYALLPYSLIEQRIDTPILCGGYAFFENGELAYFKAAGQPQKHHALQIWQTPYVGESYQPPTQTDSYLYKIGNKDVVRGMAECHETLNLIAKEDTYANLFHDLAKKTGDILDSYYWIAHDDACNLSVALKPIKEAAQAAIAEYEKVVSVKRNTRQQLQTVSTRTREIVTAIYSRRFEAIGDFVRSLSDLRAVRGEIISLRELRYVDLAVADALEKETEENTEQLAQRCVEFLLKPKALAPYEVAVAEHNGKIDGLKKVTDAKALEERVTGSASELEMLIEIVSNLKIDDTTHRTAIIDNISEIFAHLNQTRAGLKTKMQELGRVEGVAEFNSQVKLLNQSAVNYLDICNTPERCEEYLTKLMVQVEELEGRFAEFDEFVVQLTEKREEVYNAFEARKLQLVEARNRRATALMSAADRILRGIKARVDGFEQINEINGYFAADLMIEKVRDIVKQLGELDDTVKVDDIQSRLKTIKEDAVRQLKDRKELYEDGDHVIRFGTRRFSVNSQALDLTTVLRDGELYYHLTGTDFFERIDSAELLAMRDVWTQEVISESPEVYRAEFLAHEIFRTLGTDGLPTAAEILALNDEDCLEFVRRFMGTRYTEAYVKGVHDSDAVLILRALLELSGTIGLLRHHPRARALAMLFWRVFAPEGRNDLIAAKLKGFGSIREVFPQTEGQRAYILELQTLLGEFVERTGLFPAELAEDGAEYLFEELTRGGQFAISARARDLRHALLGHLQEKFFTEKYQELLAQTQRDPVAAFLLQRDWVEAYAETQNDPLLSDYIDEVAALLVTESYDAARVIEASAVRDLTGMVGNHPLIENKTYRLNYNNFIRKLEGYKQTVAPRFEAYNQLKKDLVAEKRESMRLEEFRPRVLTSFVRNKLIDQVYLHMVGDNLAKQIGEAGEGKRTDRMGLLLLISPPGYGKTTLMEYIANRLGIIFMKINGPALGHKVTSLDPVEAPNAAAREEMVKLNLAFEMGDNVMIYVDDIQHCNPEFLQKFISLCDATRKIEGVYNGRTSTYDLRGKKVAIVMAGNPYTESGEKFIIPDMLANRADTYNLGEIIGDNADAFVLSYLENSLTSNPVLNQLAARSQKDVYSIVELAQRHAQGGAASQEGVEFEGEYSLDEINEMVAVMRKLMRVRDVVLRVNEEYIRSAGQSDEFRTEPAFKLQGSYRNMSRLAEKVVAIMNDEELGALIFGNYQNDAQTLTTGMESNLLKFRELTGSLGEIDAERWASIKKTYSRNVQLQGIGDDAKFGQLVLQLTNFGDGLDAIQQALSGGLERMLAAGEKADEKAAEPQAQALTASFDPQTLEAMRELVNELKAAYLESAEAAREAQVAPAPPPPIAAPAPAAAPAEAPKIQVITRVPKSILDVLQQQFKVMEGWMAPMLKETGRQSREIKQLKELLGENLEKYEVLMKKLRQAADDEDVED